MYVHYRNAHDCYVSFSVGASYHCTTSLLSESDLTDESPRRPCATWSCTGCLTGPVFPMNKLLAKAPIDPLFLFKANYPLRRQFLLSMFCPSSPAHHTEGLTLKKHFSWSYARREKKKGSTLNISTMQTQLLPFPSSKAIYSAILQIVI